MVGMEILDNMPHDRIYLDSEGKFESQAEVEINTNVSTGEENLKEHRMPITDSLLLEFIEHHESMPEADHIKATSRI